MANIRAAHLFHKIHLTLYIRSGGMGAMDVTVWAEQIQTRNYVVVT